MVNRCDKFDRHGRRCWRSWHLDARHQYVLLAPVGAKRARELVALALFREAVRERSDGMCEAQGLIRPDGGTVCGTRPHPGADPHHLFPEDRDRGIHDPDRGVFICRAAHDFVHLWPAEAHVLGLLRPDPLLAQE